MTTSEYLKRTTPPALLAAALWGMLQIVRVTAFPTVQAILAGHAAMEWLYPSIVDVLIGVSAPLIAWLIWRQAGFWPRLAALIWFAVSALARVETLILNLISAKPDTWFGMSQGTTGLLLALFAVLDVWAAVVVMRHLRLETAAHPVGQLKPPRALLVMFLVWGVLQIGRLIAIPILQNIFSGGTDHPAWLLPAFGDIVIALTAPVVMWLFARKRGLWVWAVALAWLFLSIYDHMSTVVASSTTPPPQIFGGGTAVNAATGAFPAIQAGIDAVLFIGMALWLTARRPHSR
ncbi:MAG: hypothetical protein WAZ19_11720 [Anaerolineae bacterium]